MKFSLSKVYGDTHEFVNSILLNNIFGSTVI